MRANRGPWSLFGPRFKRDGSDPADLVVADADIFTPDKLKPRARSLAVRAGASSTWGTMKGRPPTSARKRG